jgi:rubrerythrin
MVLRALPCQKEKDSVMALVDIYTVKNTNRIKAVVSQSGAKSVWKCGACKRGILATATSWEDFDIKEECPMCKRKIETDILGQ